MKDFQKLKNGRRCCNNDPDFPIDALDREESFGNFLISVTRKGKKGTVSANRVVALTGRETGRLERWLESESFFTYTMQMQKLERKLEVYSGMKKLGAYQLVEFWEIKHLMTNVQTLERVLGNVLTRMSKQNGNPLDLEMMGLAGARKGPRPPLTSRQISKRRRRMDSKGNMNSQRASFAGAAAPRQVKAPPGRSRVAAGLKPQVKRKRRNSDPLMHKRQTSLSFSLPPPGASKNRIKSVNRPQGPGFDAESPSMKAISSSRGSSVTNLSMTE